MKVKLCFRLTLLASLLLLLTSTVATQSSDPCNELDWRYQNCLAEAESRYQWCVENGDEDCEAARHRVMCMCLARYRCKC